LRSQLERAREIVAELQATEAADLDPWADVDPEDL
jgi:hypothetical protein